MSGYSRVRGSSKMEKSTLLRTLESKQARCALPRLLNLLRRQAFRYERLLDNCKAEFAGVEDIDMVSLLDLLSRHMILIEVHRMHSVTCVEMASPTSLTSACISMYAITLQMSIDVVRARNRSVE